MKFKIGDKIKLISEPDCRPLCEDCPINENRIETIINYNEDIKRYTISISYKNKTNNPCPNIKEENMELVGILTQHQRILRK